MKKTKNYWDLSIANFDAKVDLKGITDGIVELKENDTLESINAVAKKFKTSVFYGSNAQCPKRYTLVPTKDEAIDYLFMLQLERDISFDEDDE